MKKWIVWILMLCVIIASIPPKASAKGVGQEVPEAVQIVRALGIMTGDDRGSLNLSQYVTRAEFVKMAVAASKYKDNVGVGTGVSLYRDVKSNHWASRYIQIAVNEGWFTGYTDGSFHPDESIKLEEGATVILRLLGYAAEDLQGVFPSAQLSKCSALGLNAEVTATPGTNLNRLDCAKLFSNLLVTPMKSGELYGSKLGYEIKSGSIQYATLINANTKGPIVVQNQQGFIPPFKGAAIWKNGAQSAANMIMPNDVYYYNVPMNTIWVYDTKMTGTLSEIAPNTAAPDKVTVAGKEYSLATSSAAVSVSSSGTYRKGDVVTLLLGKNGEVVQIISAERGFNKYYGIVISSEKESTQIGDDAKVRYKVKIACMDGMERIFFAKSVYTSAGRAVSVTYESGETQIESLPVESVSGLFSNQKLGNYSLAPNIQILDSDGKGAYQKIFPSRLFGVRLERKDVLYYSMNASNEIENIILQNATGDIGQYGLITSVRNEESSDNKAMSGEYKWLVNGERGALNVQNQQFNLAVGGAKFEYTSGEISSIRKLSAVNLTDITALYGKGKEKKYSISERVQVYMSTGTGYSLTNLSSVLHSDRYHFTGYIDEFGAVAGEQIRILVAKEK